MYDVKAVNKFNYVELDFTDLDFNIQLFLVNDNSLKYRTCVGKKVTSSVVNDIDKRIKYCFDNGIFNNMECSNDLSDDFCDYSELSWKSSNNPNYF